MLLQEKRYMNEKLVSISPEFDIRRKLCKIEMCYKINDKKTEIYYVVFISGKMEISCCTKSNKLFKKIISEDGKDELFKYIKKDLNSIKNIYSFFYNPIANLGKMLLDKFSVENIDSILSTIAFEKNKLIVNSKKFKLKKLINPDSEEIKIVNSLEETVKNYNKAIDYIVYSKDIEAKYLKPKLNRN